MHFAALRAVVLADCVLLVAPQARPPAPPPRSQLPAPVAQRARTRAAQKRGGAVFGSPSMEGASNVLASPSTINLSPPAAASPSFWSPTSIMTDRSTAGRQTGADGGAGGAAAAQHDVERLVLTLREAPQLGGTRLFAFPGTPHHRGPAGSIARRWAARCRLGSSPRAPCQTRTCLRSTTRPSKVPRQATPPSR